MSSERASAFWYTAISVAVAAVFFLATGGAGRYPPVARYGGAAWVFLLSMVITMPLVSSYFRRRRPAGGGSRSEHGGSEIPGVPGAVSTVSPRVEKTGGMVMAKDPVCGMDVDPARSAGSSVYRGETFHFCSRACKEAFDRNPERYVSRPGGAAGRGPGHGEHGRHGCGHCC
ncbi:MAG: YHS domain-containing protein [Bacillota bacterium]|nr:YHS domain-containing protein [Bacillota bacterium]